MVQEVTPRPLSPPNITRTIIELRKPTPSRQLSSAARPEIDYQLHGGGGEPRPAPARHQPPIIIPRYNVADILYSHQIFYAHTRYILLSLDIF